MGIILASQSPRRRELLTLLGLTFTAVPSEGEIAPAGLPPGETVKNIAGAKAQNVAARHPGDVIIAADTLVFLDGALLGKPRDQEDAARMLRLLSGRTHEVYTGVCVQKDRRADARFEKTAVRFRAIDDDEIARYIASGEPADKAGAYGAQGRGAVFIERIEGDFFNVMGLPLCRLSSMLKGYDILI
ncbi:MAG: Maf family protein [Oscillospiraceae bacterium]|jgi:septum formation protein|nr:Maf family protein [Oscillospiraceae bacterium]